MSALITGMALSIDRFHENVSVSTKCMFNPLEWNASKVSLAKAPPKQSIGEYDVECPGANQFCHVFGICAQMERFHIQAAKTSSCTSPLPRALNSKHFRIYSTVLTY